MSLYDYIDKRQADKLNKRLEEIRIEVAVKANTSALNKVASKVLTGTNKKIALNIGARVKDIKKRTKLRRARWGDIVDYGELKAFIHAYASPLPAIRLVHGNQAAFVQRRGKRQRSTGAYSIGGLRIGKRFYPGAFIQIINKNNTLHVLQRKQKATWISPGVRAPTRVVKIPLQAAVEQNLPATAEMFMKRDYAKTLSRELDYYLEQVTGIN